jgi:hypothetical protein
MEQENISHVTLEDLVKSSSKPNGPNFIDKLPDDPMAADKDFLRECVAQVRG